MKILYITNELNKTTGWGVVGYNNVRCISKNHIVDVITLKDAINESFEGVKIYKLITSMTDSKLKIPLLLLDSLKIKLKVNLNKYDVIHILVEPLIPMLNFIQHKNVFLNLTGTYSDKSFTKGFNKIFYKKGLLGVNQYIAISKYTKERFILSSGSTKNINVLPLGIDTSSIKLKNINKTNSICFVGHIKRRKGLDFILKAVNELKEKYENIKLYIIGGSELDIHTDKNYLKECKQYIKSNNLEKNVLFRGIVSDAELGIIYESSKLNILASQNIEQHFEGFGLVHLEANAFGTITIGTKGCGNECAIEEGVNGYLVPQNDYLEMINIINIVFSMSDDEYKLHSIKCKEYAKSRDWKYYANELQELYKI